MDADVIVIGAGAAGLAAAGELAGKHRVIVVEARGRAGGRILTQTMPGDRRVELGAEFVHGGNAALCAALRQARIRTRRVGDAVWLAGDGKPRRDREYWDTVRRVCSAIPENSRLPFAKAVRRMRGVAADDVRRVQSYVENFNAAPAGRISAASLAAEDGGADETQYRPVGGYGQFVDFLLARARSRGAGFRWRSPVARVRWGRGRVDVSGVGFSATARAVLVTFPVGVWRAGTVRFDPPLRKKSALARKLGWGHVLRIAFRFQDGFWGSDLVPRSLRAKGRAAFGFLIAPGFTFASWWAPEPREPVLIGWAGGPHAEAMLHHPPSLWRNEALRCLARAWQCPAAALRRRLRAWWVHDWSRDIHTLGAYSYPVAGFERAPQRFARPVNGTVFIAGEAVADELGTVHGAVSTGLRAAGEISSALSGSAGRV